MAKIIQRTQRRLRSIAPVFYAGRRACSDVKLAGNNRIRKKFCGKAIDCVFGFLIRYITGKSDDAMFVLSDKKERALSSGAAPDRIAFWPSIVTDAQAPASGPSASIA